MPKTIDIILPRDAHEGTQSILESWFKSAGEPVSANEPIVEINTDKVSMEIAAPAGGILSEILKDSGEALSPGEVLGRITLTDRESAARPQGAESDPKPEMAQQSPKRRISPLAKRMMESHDISPDQVPGSNPGGRIIAEDVRRFLAESPEIAAEGEQQTAGREQEDLSGRFSPLVRRLLKENNLDPTELRGSGQGGRITAADVETYLKTRPAALDLKNIQTGGIPSRLVPHSSTRIHTARHMVDSLLKTAPHVTAVFEADLSAVMAHRKANLGDYESRGVKLTYTAYFVDALVQALQAAPEVNSRWHDQALEIFQDANVGIATATEGGLLVPVLQRAHTLSLFGIAERLQDLTVRAREGQLTTADMRSGTITISNHGVSGSLLATPIILQPQSAILGIGKMEKRVIVVEKGERDEAEIRPMCYVTLTIDHRALDGFQANAFLSRFVDRLQEWRL